MAAKKKKSKKSGKKSKGKEPVKAPSHKEPIPIVHEPARGPDALLLHYVANNDAFALSQLFQRWPNIDINRQERDGRTALHFAIQLKQAHIVRLLTQAGAKTNIKTNTGKSPLMEAILTATKDIVKDLIQNTSDVNQTDRKQFTALHFAVQRADPVLVKMLIQGGADPACKDSDGRTPWHWANYLGHDHIARLLSHSCEDQQQPDVWEQYQSLPWFQQAIQSLRATGGKSKKSGSKKSKKSKA